VAAASEDALFEEKAELPPVPEDPRLTVGGAVLGPDGKLDVGAYEDLHTYFAGEPAPPKHPMPEKPGVRVGEDVPKGLRTWDDLRAGAAGKDGAGWIAVRARKNEPKKEKWFNIRTCGSWRLAFLLARLQRELFERGVGIRPGSAEAAAKDGESTAGGDAPVAAVGKASTPQKRKAPADAKASARKKAKAEARPPAPPVAPKTTPAISADVLAGSVRVQQILAARRAQEEKQQQQASSSAVEG